jgi:glycosyltransferase involved in cell wall biosynthesis
VSWRDAYHKLLAGADWVKAPSPDTVKRFVRYFPDISIAAVPHREQLPAPASQVAVRYNPSDTLRVAIIGAIGPHKGSQVLESLARDAKERALDVEYVVVGYTDRDARLREIGNIRITGRYKEQDIYPILRDQRCHIALLPAVWPETYSYTLSIARAAGYPTVVFDLGAPAERLSGVDEALLLPLELARRPSELNDRLLEFARASVNQVIMASSLEVGASSVRQLVARS